MTTEITQLKPQEVLTVNREYDFKPQTFDQAWHLAQIMSDSDLVPKDFRKKPQNVFLAMQAGHEIGLPSLQAVQSIAIINGRPSLWGDALLALVKGSPLCEYFMEEYDEATQTATARTLRKGDPSETVRSFSMNDAKVAGLAGKQGPWTTYPKRMAQLRARGFCARDAYPDVLRGIHSAEEQTDIPRPIGSGTTAAAQQPAPVEKLTVAKIQPMGEEEGIKFYGNILEMAGNVADLKNSFTEGWRWAKGIKSAAAEKNLKSLYDTLKSDLDAAELSEEQAQIEPEKMSDSDWQASLKAADLETDKA